MARPVVADRARRWHECRVSSSRTPPGTRALVAAAAVALAGAAGPLGAAGCARAPATVDGRALFAQLCAACHGERGKPMEAMVARLGVRDLTDPAFRARVTAALVEKQVRGGSANKLMPAFAGAISDAQIAALAAYVADPAFAR